jgi:hypothetical protein
MDRIRSELFNAGNEWEDALAGPAIASYAMSVNSLFHELPRRLVDSSNYGMSIVDIVEDAKSASAEAGFSPAVAIAERALFRLIIVGVDGLQGSEQRQIDPSARWRELRGSEPTELVANYAGELIGQYARHVVDREVGRLVSAAPEVRATEVSTAVSAAAFEVARSVATVHLSDQPISIDTWSSLLHRTFNEGRTLPALKS